MAVLLLDSWNIGKQKGDAILREAAMGLFLDNDYCIKVGSVDGNLLLHKHAFSTYANCTEMFQKSCIAVFYITQYLLVTVLTASLKLKWQSSNLCFNEMEKSLGIREMKVC